MTSRKKLTLWAWIAIVGLGLIHGTYSYIRDSDTVHYIAFISSLPKKIEPGKIIKASKSPKPDLIRSLSETTSSEVAVIAYSEFADIDLFGRRIFDIRPVIGSPELFKVDLIVRDEATGKKLISHVVERMNTIYLHRQNFTLNKNADGGLKFGVTSEFQAPQTSRLSRSLSDAVFTMLFLTAFFITVLYFVRSR